MAVLLAAASLLGPKSAVAAPPDFDLPSGGHFFSQAGDNAELGYTVTDAEGSGFWTAFKALGGVDSLGYPTSHRFIYNNRVTQVFQRAVLQAGGPGDEADAKATVEVLPVLDLLSAAGKDEWLETARSIPRRFDLTTLGLPSNASREQRITAQQAFLYERAALKDAYFAAKDPLARWGLPTSRPVDTGDAWVVRTEAGVLQEWKVEKPWAKAGAVTVGLAGDLFKESNLIIDKTVWEAKKSPEEPAPPARPSGVIATGAWQGMPGERWIDVNLSSQRVSAMVGSTVVHVAPGTTGKRGWETPVGNHYIFSRVFNETMDSATLGIPRSSSEGYYLPNIYFTQYFAGGGYAIHSNYWQPDSVFGNYPSSHGCVGLRYNDAQFFWNFATFGTRVFVHY